MLSALSLLLNGGGIGQLQDITESLSTALAGREQDLRSLIEQLDMFTRHVNDQSADIIATADSLNTLAGRSPTRSRWWTRRWRPSRTHCG